MVTLVYLKSLSPEPKNFVNIRVNSVGDWLPSNATSTELQRFNRMPTKPDGNCLFQALASAAVVRKVAHQAKIDELRKKLVEYLSEAIRTWPDDEVKAFTLTVGAVFYPTTQRGVKRTLWRVYQRDAFKLLKRKRQKTTMYDLRADAQVLLDAGIPVNDSASYLEYLAYTGRQ